MSLDIGEMSYREIRQRRVAQEGLLIVFIFIPTAVGIFLKLSLGEYKIPSDETRTKYTLYIMV